MQDFVTLEGVVKRYHSGEVVTTAADGVSFGVEEGEFAIIVGPSGAGKPTVLNVLGGMDTCDEGKIVVQDQEVSSMTARELAHYRRYDIGFVFQFYNLVQNLTARENVELASQICPNPLEAGEALASVGPVSYTHLDVYKRQRQYICHPLALSQLSGHLADKSGNPGILIVLAVGNQQVQLGVLFNLHSKVKEWLDGTVAGHKILRTRAKGHELEPPETQNSGGDGTELPDHLGNLLG